MNTSTVVDRGDYTFECLPPAVVIYFAALEQSGCRALVENERRELDKIERSKGKDVPHRNLEASMAFKAYTGTMFTNGQRYPLYEVKNFYSSSPTDVIFGAGVKPKTLSDTNIAHRMEDIMELDTDELVWQFSSKVKEFFSLESHDYFLDNSDVDFFGRVHGDATGKAAVMKYSRKCKSGRTEALHKEFMNVCCGNGVLCYAHVFDGATTDTEMDLKALDKLLDKIDPRKDVLSGDCKFCDTRIISKLTAKGYCFVTKVPANFSGKILKKVRDSAILGTMDDSEKYPGRSYYETHDIITDLSGNEYGDMRLLAFRLPGGVKRAREYLENQGLKNFRKELNKVWHKRFCTREEAVEAMLDVMDAADEPVYIVDAEYDQDRKCIKEGKPPWLARIKDVKVDESMIDEAALRYSVQVLITNTPFALEDNVIPRNGMTSDTVVNRYLNQCTIEKRFRMQKTCHGVAHIFIHTPIRQDSMILMDCLATSMQSAMDAVMKRDRAEGRRAITMEMLGDKLVACRVGFDRSSDRIFFSGDPESRELFFEAVDLLKLDLRYAFLFA